MRVSGRLVRRYARALFEVAQESGAAAVVGADLGRIAQALADPALASVVLDPSSDRASKRRAFDAGVSLESPLLRTFVHFLLERRREDVLPALASAFAAEVDRAEGRVRGIVESGRALPEEERRALESALGASLGARVSLTVRVDPALVGGVRIEVGGRRLDATVPGRLAALREELLAAPLRQS